MGWGTAETWPLRYERPSSLPSCFPGRLWETSPGLTQMWNRLIRRSTHSRGSAAFLVNLPLLSHHRIPPSPLPSLFPAPSYPSVLLPLHPYLGSFPRNQAISHLLCHHTGSLHESQLAAPRHTHVNRCVLCAETGSEQGRAGQSGVEVKILLGLHTVPRVCGHVAILPVRQRAQGRHV